MKNIYDSWKKHECYDSYSPTVYDGIPAHVKLLRKICDHNIAVYTIPSIQCICILSYGFTNNYYFGYYAVRSYCINC